MPPEQAEGKEVDERADVYALGAILYHLLSGAPPYQGAEPSKELLAQIQKTSPAPVEQLQPETPRDLCALVAKAMARHPKDRYPNAKELCRDLERFLRGGFVKAHRYSFIERLQRRAARYRVAFFVAGVFLVLLLGVGLYSVERILDAKTRAEDVALLANKDRGTAVERLELLALSQARSLVEESPAKALAALRLISPGSSFWRAARIRAADIQRRGVARVFVGLRGSINYACPLPQSQLIVTAEDEGIVQIWDTVSEQARIFTEHKGAVTFVACAPDGRSFVTTGEDQNILLWEVESGKSTLLHQTQGAILDMAFSPDGQQLATATQSGAIELISLSSRKAQSLLRQKKVMRSVQFSPDGRYLAAVGNTDQVLLYDLTTQRSSFLTNPGDLQRVRFSPDGKWLATASYFDGVYLWSLEQKSAKRLTGATGEVWSLAFSPDQKTLASVGQDKRLWLWDLSACNPQSEAPPEECGKGRALEGHQSSIRWVTFSADGSLLATTGMDRSVRIWDTVTLQPRALEGHEDVVSRAYFLSEERLLTTSWDGTLRLWELRTGEKVWPSTSPEASRYADYSPDGRYVLTRTSSATVRLTNVLTGEAHEIKVSEDPGINQTHYALFSPDSKSILVGGDREAQLWSLQGTRLSTFSGHNARVSAGAFSPDGSLIATGSLDGTTRVWSVSTNTSLLLRSASGEISGVAFSPNGEYLAATESGDSPKIAIWKKDCFGRVAKDAAPSACEPAYLFDGVAGPNEHPLFSPDNRFLTTTSSQVNSVVVFHLETKERKVLPAHGTYNLTQAFSPDGSLMVTVGLDTAIRIWDTSNWTFRELRGHQNYLESAAFSPDGKSLATAGYDQTVRVWDIESGESRSVPAPDKEVIRVFFSPNGEALLSVSELGTIRRWPDDAPRQEGAFWRWLHTLPTYAP